MRTIAALHALRLFHENSEAVWKPIGLKLQANSHPHRVGRFNDPGQMPLARRDSFFVGRRRGEAGVLKILGPAEYLASGSVPRHRMDILVESP